MKLTNLEQANDFEVARWLEKELNLTPYQKEVLRDREVIRFSPFYFYKRKVYKKVSFLFRLTVVFIPIYYLLILIGLPFTWIFSGKWGYGQKFYDKFHAVWMNKLNL